MKNIFHFVIFAAVFFLASLKSEAQFNSGVTITGTTNAQLIVGSSVPTNYATFYLPTKALTISSGISTNETVVFSYGFTVAGSTNIVILGSLTNSFAGYTNSTWSTNIPPQSFAVPVVPWAQAAIGSFTNVIQTIP
jgi:hypothetical protein